MKPKGDFSEQLIMQENMERIIKSLEPFTNMHGRGFGGLMTSKECWIYMSVLKTSHLIPTKLATSVKSAIYFS
jgi:hypothetical protein